MHFESTRNSSLRASGAEAIVKGLAPDGGLFVPAHFPTVEVGEIEAMVAMGYEQRAKLVLSRFLTDYTDAELEACTRAAYAAVKFGEKPAPLNKVGDEYLLELWHGPTHAFKDMALQILPHLMVLAMQKTGTEKTVQILVATSGDTGKAALEGFKDVAGTKVLVFFPAEGVSAAQRMQMLTQEGENVSVCAVKGNFDDTQSGVKAIFADEAIAEALAKKNVELSSANSINFGRLVPQIAYYFSAYADLLASGEINLGDTVNFCVPTGNFGNILASYYAKRMGLPVGKLLCASNKNNILADFIHSGVYDMNREFFKTSSPSMDILISSNLERLLYELGGRDDARLRALMQSLKDEGRYAISQEMQAALAQDFAAGWVDDATGAEAIRQCFEENGYIMDTHTAIAYHVAKAYKQKTADPAPMVVVSTASPYKFSGDVLQAIQGVEACKGLDEFACAENLEQATNLLMPKSLKELKDKPILHHTLVEVGQMADVVLK